MEPGLKAILEALLFTADEPLPLRRLAAVLEDSPSAAVRTAVEELRADYAALGGALQVVEVAGGYRLLTRREFAPWIARLLASPSRPRLSQPALETLAIIAYKQPVTRVELEEIRGVNVEAVLKTLIERDLVSITGRDEGIGRPLLYATTETFLSYFGLNSAADLPRMDEIEVFLAERERAWAETEPAPEAEAETEPAPEAEAEPVSEAGPASEAAAESPIRDESRGPEEDHGTWRG